MSEMKCYTGGRLPVLGTPSAVVGFNNDKEQKTLLFETHVFFDGKAKTHHCFQFQSDYEQAETGKVDDYISVVNQMVQDQIEKIILDEMMDKNIPVHLYNQVAPCDPKDYTLLLYSLCSRGFAEEFQSIATTSIIEKLQSEFSKVMKFAKVLVTFPAAK